MAKIRVRVGDLKRVIREELEQLDLPGISSGGKRPPGRVEPEDDEDIEGERARELMRMQDIDRRYGPDRRDRRASQSAFESRRRVSEALDDDYDDYDDYDADDAALSPEERVLKSLEGATVSDVPYLKYSATKNRVIIEDTMDDTGVQRLGNMHFNLSAAELERYGLTPQQFGDYLAANGAKKLRTKRRVPRSFSPYD